MLLGLSNLLQYSRVFLIARYSRGQPKPTKKNEYYLMAKKMPGKHADRLRQAHGQFSSQSHEPFLK